MTATKHTEGPWHATYYDETVATRPHWGVDCNFPDMLSVASVHHGYGRPGEEEANARLIAAAPDLLAALKAVVRVADRATDVFDAARAAIAKAEGQS